MMSYHEYEPDSPSEQASSDNDESLCGLEGDDLEENLSLWVSSSSLVVYHKTYDLMLLFQEELMVVLVTVEFCVQVGQRLGAKTRPK